MDNIINKFWTEGVERRRLGEVCKIKTGDLVTKKIVSLSPGEFPVINSGCEPLGFINMWNTDKDPIGITSRGIGAGSVTWCEGKYYRGNLNYSCTIKDSNVLLVRFLYFLLQYFQREIKNFVTHDCIPALNKRDLEKLVLPVPPLEVQEEIVRTLDYLPNIQKTIIELIDARKRQAEIYLNYIFQNIV